MKRLFGLFLSLITVSCSAQVNVQGSNIQIGGTGSSTGSVLDAPQNRIYIQPNPGTNPVAGPATTTNSAVAPILQGELNTDLNGGITASLVSPLCSAGCGALVPPSSTSSELPYWYTHFLDAFGNVPDNTHVNDARFGATYETLSNPTYPSAMYGTGWIAKVRNLQYTKPMNFQYPFYGEENNFVLGLKGGYNFYTGVPTAPFKSTYGGHSDRYLYTTPGQHDVGLTEMFGWSNGDLIDKNTTVIEARASAGDPSDEGAHPGKLFIYDPNDVTSTTCSAGCTNGSTTISIPSTPKSGERQTVENWRSANVFNSTSIAGCRIVSGYSQDQPLASVTVSSACAIAQSTTVMTATNFPDSAGVHAVGTVTAAIKTSSVPAGYSTDLSAFSASGVACAADYNLEPTQSNGPDYYERVSYTKVDSTHITVTFNNPHPNPVILAIGGLCGKDFVARGNIDTQVDSGPVSGKAFQALRVVFSRGNVLYLGDYAHTVNVLDTGASTVAQETTVAYNTYAVLALSRTGNVTTASINGGIVPSLENMVATISGAADSSFNATNVTFTQTGPQTVTYPNTGANATSTTATITYDMAQFQLVPNAQIATVLNASNGHFDGGNITLYPNDMPLTNGDPLVFPTGSQLHVGGGGGFNTLARTLPAPNYGGQTDGQGFGLVLANKVGASVAGYTVINNVYLPWYRGYGGVKSLPHSAYQWTQRSAPFEYAMEGPIGDLGGLHFLMNFWATARGRCDWRSPGKPFIFENGTGNPDSFLYNPCTQDLTWSSSFHSGKITVLNNNIQVQNYFAFVDGAETVKGQISRANDFFFLQQDTGSGMNPTRLGYWASVLNSDGYVGFGNVAHTTGNISNPDTFLTRSSPGVMSIDNNFNNHQGELQLTGLDLYSPSAAAYVNFRTPVSMPGSYTITAAAAPPPSLQFVTMDSSGQIGYATGGGVAALDYYWTQNVGCTVGGTLGDNCAGTVQLPGNMPDSSYFILCTSSGIAGGSYSLTLLSNPATLPTTAGSSINYEIGTVVSPGGSQIIQAMCHAHHN